MSLSRRFFTEAKEDIKSFFTLNSKLSRPAMLLMLASARLGSLPIYLAEGMFGTHLLALFLGDKSNQECTKGRSGKLFSKHNLSLIGAGALLLGHAGWGTINHVQSINEKTAVIRADAQNQLIRDGLTAIKETPHPSCYADRISVETPDLFSWGSSRETYAVRITPDDDKKIITLMVLNGKGATLRKTELPLTPTATPATVDAAPKAHL